MHPRSLYHIAPDFGSLALSYPPLYKHLKGKTIDFHNDSAQRCLTQALLKRDFDLEISLPPDRLCPPVPNRLNYVLWIQDIVRAHADEALGRRRLRVHGLDIGTGASAIYPLLACRLEPEWSFVATEIDEQSYNQARANVASNGLEHRIRIIKVEHVRPKTADSTQCVDFEEAEKDPTPKTTEVESQSFGFDKHFADGPYAAVAGGPAARTTAPESEAGADLVIEFTMCNPPFYSSDAEVLHSEEGKEAGPYGVCTGAPVEMITPGGEARFVGDMVRESVLGAGVRIGTANALDTDAGETDGEARAKKRRRIDASDEDSETVDISTRKQGGKTVKSRWYTSMLGKLSSVAEVVDSIKGSGINNYATTEFVQGQTRRWAVGWSLGKWRLGDEISRIQNPNSTLQRLLPPRNTLRLASGPKAVKGRLREVLADIEDVSVDVQGEDPADRLPPASIRLVVRADRDTWSRSARRKRQKRDGAPDRANDHASGPGVESTSSAPDPALICAIVADVKEIEFRWVYGDERALFESFASHVGKKVEACG